MQVHLCMHYTRPCWEATNLFLLGFYLHAMAPLNESKSMQPQSHSLSFTMIDA
jgi:hypothetical protein